MMLKRSDEGGHSYLVSDLSEKVLSFLPLSMMAGTQFLLLVLFNSLFILYENPLKCILISQLTCENTRDLRS